MQIYTLLCNIRDLGRGSIYLFNNVNAKKCVVPISTLLSDYTNDVRNKGDIWNKSVPINFFPNLPNQPPLTHANIKSCRLGL